jgi:hypothetical protein
VYGPYDVRLKKGAGGRAAPATSPRSYSGIARHLPQKLRWDRTFKKPKMELIMIKRGILSGSWESMLYLRKWRIDLQHGKPSLRLHSWSKPPEPQPKVGKCFM